MTSTRPILKKFLSLWCVQKKCQTLHNISEQFSRKWNARRYMTYTASLSGKTQSRSLNNYA